MYNATISGVTTVSGMLTVSVNFTDPDGKQFVETFQTNQAQPSNWIQTMVTNRLANLNALPTIASEIVVGTTINTTLVANSITTLVPGSKASFAADLKTLNQMIAAQMQGIMSRTDPTFVALQAKLVAEFQPSYVDLF